MKIKKQQSTESLEKRLAHVLIDNPSRSRDMDIDVKYFEEYEVYILCSTVKTMHNNGLSVTEESVMHETGISQEHVRDICEYAYGHEASYYYNWMKLNYFLEYIHTLPKDDKKNNAGMISLEAEKVYREIRSVNDYFKFSYEMDFFRGFDRLIDESSHKSGVSDISRATGISANTIRNWKRRVFRNSHENFIPNWKNVESLLDYYRTECNGSLSYLLNGEPKKIRNNDELSEYFGLSLLSILCLKSLNSNQAHIFNHVITSSRFSGILSCLDEYYVHIKKMLDESEGDSNLSLLFETESERYKDITLHRISEFADRLIQDLSEELYVSGALYHTPSIDFSRGLRRILDEYDWYADDLACVLGITPSTVRGWIQENGSVPGLPTLEKMCTLFDCSPDYLMNLTDYKYESRRIAGSQIGMIHENAYSWITSLNSADNNNFDYILKNNEDNLRTIMSDLIFILLLRSPSDNNHLLSESYLMRGCSFIVIDKEEDGSCICTFRNKKYEFRDSESLTAFLKKKQILDYSLFLIKKEFTEMAAHTLNAIEKYFVDECL